MLRLFHYHGVQPSKGFGVGVPWVPRRRSRRVSSSCSWPTSRSRRRVSCTPGSWIGAPCRRVFVAVLVRVVVGGGPRIVGVLAACLWSAVVVLGVCPSAGVGRAQT